MTTLLDLLTAPEIVLMRQHHDPLWTLPPGTRDRGARMAAVYAAEDAASAERHGELMRPDDRREAWPVRAELPRAWGRGRARGSYRKARAA